MAILFPRKFIVCFWHFCIGLGTSGGQMVQFAGAGGKNQPQQPQQARPGSAGSNSSGGDKDLTGNLELGELGQLTITNDNESAYDVSTTFWTIWYSFLAKKI